MATRKPKFPPECCGVCRYSQPVKGSDQLKCIGSPASMVFDGERLMACRGAPVDPLDPACALFKPRCHA